MEGNVMGFIATLAVKVIADTQSYEKSMEGAKSKAASIGKAMVKTGAVMTAGLTLPIVAIGVAAVNMASDVEESVSKVNTLFGESADEVVSWSETTATAYGIAKADALDYAGELGNVLLAQGLSGDSAADLSVEMVELAADMASFNNASPEETFAAIQAGAIGSSEPLRKYGVVISAASVNQKALEMTGKATTAELTEQDKTLARLKLIVEQTTAAHGDFAKTSDGLSNSTKIAQASFKDIGAELGQQLLPIGLKLIGWVQRAITWFDNLTEGNKKVILIVIGLVAAIGPLISIIGGLIGIFTTVSAITIPTFLVAAGPILLIVGAIIAIIALLLIAWKNDWGGIQAKTKAVVDFLRTMITRFIDKWKVDFERGKEFVASLSEGFVNAFEGIKKAIGWVIDKIKILIDWFSKIKVPDILTGKSPSPFEVSLRGIGSAIDDLNTKQIPGLASGLGAVGGAASNINNYYLNYSGVESTEMDIEGHLNRLMLMRR